MALFACKVGGSEGSTGNIIGTCTYTARDQDQTLNVATVRNDYASLSVADFYYRCENINQGGAAFHSDGRQAKCTLVEPELTYNQSTGILTVNNKHAVGALQSQGGGTSYTGSYAYPKSITIVCCPSE